MDWIDYRATHPDNTVVGELRLLRGVHSPQLRNKRDLYVLLPPSYHRTGRRYPVVYMHDAQNLFDGATSYAGEWEVDETMAQLAEEGLEAIVVGLANSSKSRIQEYSPFDSQRFGAGKGNGYLDFLLETIKPRIDADFRTLTDRVNTGIVGSSMGGLISLYAYFRHPVVFGFAGALSPSIWYAHGAILNYVWNAPAPLGKLYLDIGAQEPTSWANRIHFDTPHRRYSATAQAMRDLLGDKGYRLGKDLRFVEDEQGTHQEAAWARRLPEALRFLLKR